ncbi:unnamed protein product, partial [Oikopleura dioica]
SYFWRFLLDGGIF